LSTIKPNDTSSKILASTGFAALDNSERKVIKDFFDNYKKEGKTLPTALTIENTLSIFRSRTNLSDLVQSANQLINKTNPASFVFLIKTQREALREELLFAFYVLNAQYHLDETESRKQNLQAFSDQLFKTAALIRRLDIEATPKNPGTLLKLEQDAYDKHCKYLGLKMGYQLGETIHELTGGYTVTTQEWMNAFNERRLYWVWGEDMIAQTFTLLPDTFDRKHQAQKNLSTPDNVLGNIGWILYYTRFGLNLSLLLKHTLKGQWMSERESTIPSSERFLTQWDQHKFSLLNDFVWATVNLVTFVWLVGKGMLGYWGNVLTTGLLLVDASLTFWRFQEETTKHNQLILKYENDINKVERRIKGAKGGAQLKLMQQLTQLKQSKTERELDWEYKNYQLVADLSYSVGLIVAFIIACSILLPPGILIPATAALINIIGSALCFTATLAYSAASGAISISHAKAQGASVKEVFGTLLEQFNEASDDNVKKALYLDMKHLVATSSYQEQLISFQKAELMRSICIDAMIPPVVFISLIFVPLGVGLGILGGGFALALFTKALLQSYKPSQQELPEFDEIAYSKFKKEPTYKALCATKARTGLFEETDPDQKPSSGDREGPEKPELAT
jgi:hypothetical protein